MKLNYLIHKNFKYQYSLLFKNLFLIYIYNSLGRSYLQKKYLLQKKKYMYVLYLSKNSVFNNININVFKINKQYQYYILNTKLFNNNYFYIHVFLLLYYLRLFLILGY